MSGVIFSIVLHIFETLIFLICKLGQWSLLFLKYQTLTFEKHATVWYSLSSHGHDLPSHIQNSKISRAGQRGANSGYSWIPEHRDQLLQRPRLFRVVPETWAYWSSQSNVFHIPCDHCGTQKTNLVWNEVSNSEVCDRMIDEACSSLEREAWKLSWLSSGGETASKAKDQVSAEDSHPAKECHWYCQGHQSWWLGPDSSLLVPSCPVVLVPRWHSYSLSHDGMFLSSPGAKIPLAKPYKSQACL